LILRSVERGAGLAGIPLVMLHGLFGRAANFGSVQARLAERRRVVALDLRGHGNSPHATPIDYPTMAADVAETLRSLEAWPCALLGHSMGGKVAMTLALTDPRAVAALVVADIAPVSYPSHFGAFAAAMLALDLVPGLTRPAADASLKDAIPQDSVRRFLMQNLRLGAQPAWTCDLSAIAAALPVIEAWPDPPGTYLGRCLFLTGGQSHYVRPQARPLIARLFPQSRLVALRRAGHWLHAEDPDGFVATVEGFLSV
jgi:pimeloyl-ACP methyl ester carboxylesterase